MEFQRLARIGALAGILALTSCGPRDPVIEKINSAGQLIADSLNNPNSGRALPTKPTARMVDGLREATNKLRGTEARKGGFRMAIGEAASVVLERPKIGPEIYSCIGEVAAATAARIPLARLQGLSDEQGAYALQMVVDAGITIAYRRGGIPTACPYVRENP